MKVFSDTMAKQIYTKASANADFKKDMLEIASSRLYLEIADFFTTAVPFTISRKNIQLMEFSDASW